jgi:hypothetical protein
MSAEMSAEVPAEALKKKPPVAFYAFLRSRTVWIAQKAMSGIPEAALPGNQRPRLA